MSREGGLTHQRLNTNLTGKGWLLIPQEVYNIDNAKKCYDILLIAGEHVAFDGQHPEIKDRLT